MVVYKRKKTAKELNSKQIAQEAVKLALDKKAKDVKILDMRQSCDFCDYFVILSADTERQIGAIENAIKEGLSKQKNVRLRSCEGISQSKWVLLDYSDIIIHIFHPDMRAFYDLERLWQDAKRVRLPSSLETWSNQKKKS